MNNILCSVASVYNFVSLPVATDWEPVLDAEIILAYYNKSSDGIYRTKYAEVDYSRLEGNEITAYAEWTKVPESAAIWLIGTQFLIEQAAQNSDLRLRLKFEKGARQFSKFPGFY